MTACAYPRVWRVAAAVCVAVSGASLPLIGVAVLTANGPAPLIVLVRALLICALLPALAACLVAYAFTVEVEVQATELVVRGRWLRMEIPRTAIAAVEPWAVPLPGAGFALRLQSGRRFSYGVQAADPTSLLTALAEGAGIDAASAAARHPALVYAHAKHSGRRRRWYHPLAKFVLFALVPTAVWFNAHQHIAYGGLLGQYYLEGLAPYLKTFFTLWSLVGIYLLLYASAWRAVAEALTLLAAWLAPERATAARRAAEVVCGVVYYVGVPLLVLLPFLQ